MTLAAVNFGFMNSLSETSTVAKENDPTELGLALARSEAAVGSSIRPYRKASSG